MTWWGWLLIGIVIFPTAMRLLLVACYAIAGVCQVLVWMLQDRRMSRKWRMKGKEGETWTLSGSRRWKDSAKR